ncbi:MAG: nicotinate (nicotinamide) nucleotide adenylyltransferase [Deltaproteobacteria bacterium]|nr:nicotinate (nicotinamide) nucleotide adenylyltransferase [Deltaproteobacteria bacterium]
MSKVSELNLPNSPQGASIGILGGSFDPPHLGHQMLALAALSTTPIGEVWIVPCASHAFNKPLSPFEHRLKMCEYAFSHLRSVQVLDLERDLPKPNYTVQTLEAIQEARPDLKLYFVMGSDLMADFDKWEGHEKIREIAELVIVDRKTLLPQAKSTTIRSVVPRQDFSNLDLKVRDYIQKTGLYT